MTCWISQGVLLLFSMIITAFFDVQDNEERFDMCFYVHKVYGQSKILSIGNTPLSCKLNTVFNIISTQFISIFKKNVVIKLFIGSKRTLEGRDCKSTIFNTANQNVSKTLKIGNEKCKLMVNMPEKTFSFPKCTASNYPVTPDFNEIDKYFDLYAFDFKWSKCSVDPKNTQTANWVEVGTTFAYCPKPDDIGHFLRFESKVRGRKETAMTMVAVADTPVVRGEPKPKWLPRFTGKNLQGCSFRVVSYNVLSDMYAKRAEERGELVHCPYYATDCTYRMDLVLKELKEYNADVICLQEVDEYAYTNMFRNFFERRGYYALYQLKHPKINEGLACFFRAYKFRLCEISCIAYPRDMFCMNPVFQYLYEEVKKNKNYADAFKSSSGILMCAVLQTGNLSRYVVVGNTHLRSGEENGHIRLMQTMMAVEHLQHIVAKYKQIGPNVEVTPVLCGDLNSLPQSSVLELLETGSLPADCPDWRSKVSEAFEGMPLQHDLRLKSAYTNLAYTNYTTDFKGCVDYIFYNCDDLQLIQTVPIPAESELQAQVALPSLAYPSDHLALVADLGWRRDADASGPSRLQAKLGDLQVAPGRRGAPKPRGRSRGGRGKAAGNT